MIEELDTSKLQRGIAHYYYYDDERSSLSSLRSMKNCMLEEEQGPVKK